MGAGASCNTVDKVDPYPGNDVTNGLKRADSEGCANCTLTVDDSNTVSNVDVLVTPDNVKITPVIALLVTFNEQQYKITELNWMYPGPIRVEGTNADAVLRCRSFDGDGLDVFVPLSTTTNSPGTSPTDFFSVLAAELGGKKDLKSVAVGQNWSMAKLIKAEDPYFTRVNADYERYVKFMIPCRERLIGWRPLRGPRTIYMANAVGVPDGDLAILRNLVTRVSPKDVFKTLPYTYFYPPNAPCTTCKKPVKALSSAPTPLSTNITNALVTLAIVSIFCLAVLVAIYIANYSGGGVSEAFSNFITSLSSPTILFLVFGLLLVLALIVAGVSGAFKTKT